MSTTNSIFIINCSSQHRLLVTIYQIHFLGWKLRFMRQRCAYCFQNYLLPVAGRLSSLPNLSLKIPIVQVRRFSSVLLQSFDILLTQNFIKLFTAHSEQYCALFCHILCLELWIFKYFFIPKEIKSFHQFVLVITVVDCTHLPSMVGHRPFVVITHIYVVVLLDASSVKQVKCFFFTSCFLNCLAFEVKLEVHALVKLFCLSVFDVKLWEKGAFHHFVYLVSFFHLELSVNNFVDVRP